jgi:hypothetical protein
VEEIKINHYIPLIPAFSLREKEQVVCRYLCLQEGALIFLDFLKKF